MDSQLGVTNQMKGKRQAARRKNKALKVVYISNPLKVKTSASNFRALVQKLTGKDSDVAERFMGDDVINEEDCVSNYKYVDQVQKLRARCATTCGVPSLNSVPSLSTCPNYQGNFFEPCNVSDMATMAHYSQESSFSLLSSFFQDSDQLGANYVQSHGRRS